VTVYVVVDKAAVDRVAGAGDVRYALGRQQADTGWDFLGRREPPGRNPSHTGDDPRRVQKPSEAFAASAADTFPELEPEGVRLAKTASRSILGFMTEMAFELGWIIADKGGLRRSDINGAVTASEYLNPTGGRRRRRALRREDNSRDQCGGLRAYESSPLLVGAASDVTPRARASARRYAWVRGCARRGVRGRTGVPRR